MARFSLMSLVLLAACGGSDGAAPVSRIDQAGQLAAAFSGENISDPGRLPQSGQAVYQGYMNANLPTRSNGGRVNYLGDLRLNVDFEAARNQVRGRAENFTAGSGARLDGRLAIRGGDILRGTDPDENYTFSGKVTGDLSRRGAAYAIDARLAGEFRGRYETGVTGVVFGDVTGPAGQDIFDGDFVAEKD